MKRLMLSATLLVGACLTTVGSALAADAPAGSTTLAIAKKGDASVELVSRPRYYYRGGNYGYYGGYRGGYYGGYRGGYYGGYPYYRSYNYGYRPYAYGLPRYYASPYYYGGYYGAYGRPYVYNWGPAYYGAYYW